MNKHSTLIKGLSVFVALNFLAEIMMPTVAWALTSGPTAPEFSSFEPVATTDMVSLSSGKFTYNLPVLEIPGTEGSGYALSLSYHSGAGIEEEASWVGYGWSLNPGAINRNLRGFPDDYNGDSVTYYNKTKPNWTSTVTFDLGVEALGLDISLGASNTTRYNNYQGFSRTIGLNAGIKGMANIGMNVTGDDVSFSLSINPVAIMKKKKDKADDNEKKDTQTKKEKISKKEDPKKYAAAKEKFMKDHQGSGKAKMKSSVTSSVSNVGVLGGSYGLYSFSEAAKATNNTPYQGRSYNFSPSIQVSPSQAPVGFEGGLSANFNVQVNTTIEGKAAYGYMHSKSSSIAGNAAAMSDYFVEKGSSYDKRDDFIGIPFNNADNFMLSGEGISGGFRAYQEELGHYYPNYSESDMDIFQLGVEFSIGTNLGIGFDFGLGDQNLTVGNWRDNNAAGDDDYLFDDTNPVSVMRFNNDMGGQVYYSENNSAEAAEVVVPPSNLRVPGGKAFDVEVPTSILHNLNDGNTPGRASYVEYHTASELAAAFSNRFNKNSNQDELLYHVDKAVDGANLYKYEDGIVEYSIFNETGTNYIYGLPVYNKDEISAQADVQPSSPKVFNYLAEEDINESGILNSNNFLLASETFIGDVKHTPYASNYLLTQILQPNYVDDVSGNGPDDSDFGGWTRFEYFKKYGTEDDWYTWRVPYSGLLYSANNLSDDEDDLGMLSKGKKEVYYLKVIETNTHYAFFVTNEYDLNDIAYDFLDDYFPSGVPDIFDIDGPDRNDARGASDGDASEDISSPATSKKLERLEKIFLFAKNGSSNPELIKTVNFEYDYSIAKNVPNNINGNWPENPNGTPLEYEESGKLTLKKVWFEYEGVYNAKISPYEFKYEYATNYEPEIEAIYPEITSYADQFTGGQNPEYTPYNLDMWGNNQYNGKNRRAKLMPWVYQGVKPNIIPPNPLPSPAPPNYEGDPFDPAAWQLKQIKLPSGGEIHIQYEQTDYSYVQNRRPMGMVSLLDKGSWNTKDDEATQGVYYLNLADIGYTEYNLGSQLATKVNELKSYLEDKYEGKDDKKLAFKFLYALRGNFLPELNGNCKTEYITGYAKLHDVTVEGPNANNEYSLKLKLGTSGEKDAPRNACMDFIRAFKGARLNNNNCTTGLENNDDQVIDNMENNTTGEYDFGNAPWSSFKTNMTSVIETAIGSIKNVAPSLKNIGKINPELSYIRIPMLATSKRGGGIRVKRLLMHDKGIESGDAMIYGTEYIYENEDGLSSGVASNEPSAGRQENALVDFIPRQKQSFLSKLVAGDDKKKAEGPLGESLLPGPAVTHSRVIVQNIHTGKTGNGYKKHEFYTTKDFPFDAYYEAPPNQGFSGKAIELTTLQDNMEKDYMMIPAGLFNFRKDRVWMSQGFRFMLHDMDGKPKSVSTYGGDYDPDNINPALNPYLSSSEEFEYFQPGENVNVLTYSSDDEEYIIKKTAPGKEMDVTMEMKSVTDVSSDFSLELDLSIGLMIPPPIFVTAMVSFDYQDSQINTHSTSKVIRYPTIMKSTRTFQDGAWHESENLAFNESTGQPVLTKNTDSFHGLEIQGSTHDGSYYQLKIPADWHYPQMGQKAVLASNTNQLQTVIGQISSYGDGGNMLGGTIVNGVLPWFSSPDGVVSAEAEVYANNWYNTSTGDVRTDENRNAVLNEYSASGVITELNKKWLPSAKYIYEEDIISANVGTNGIFNSGIYNSFNMFSHNNYTQASTPAVQWKALNKSIVYEPNGNPVMDVNILGINSAAKFAYDYSLPSIISQNSEYGSIQFHDFEMPGNFVSGTINSDAHSGYKSANYSQSMVLFQDLLITEQAKEKGMRIQFWLKTSGGDNLLGGGGGGGSSNVFPVTLDITGATKYDLHKVGQSGDWMLIEGVIPDSVFNAQALYTTYSVLLDYAPSVSPSETIKIDDARIQPADAQVTSYVYDVNTRKLLAQFDNQHYGLFYQYNHEGKLVRKQLETVRGKKTITETQYNIPTVSR